MAESLENAKRPTAEVRAVEPEEIDKILVFLRTFNQMGRFTPAALRALFEHRWNQDSEKPGWGYGLWAGDEVVGFLGTIPVQRRLGGYSFKSCNLSSWYVRSDFRWASLKLLYSALSQKEYTITNFTASPEARQIMEGLGFHAVDECKLVYLPWHAGREMFRSHPDVLAGPESIRATLNADELQYLNDHLPYGLKHYTIREGNEYSYIVLKRRFVPGDAVFGRVPLKKLRLMWYPCMEVLYLSNPILASARWKSLVASIIRDERVLAVTIAERFLRGVAPPSEKLQHRNYVLPRGPLNATMDCLYSELAILPF